MVDVVLHGPSVSPTLPKVSPEAIASAVNVGLGDKADKAAVNAAESSRSAKLVSAQQTIDSLTQSLASAHASITTLQNVLTATQARVTVLETATPPPAVPNAVASFTLGATTNTTQVLNWTAPSGGATVTFYDTKYKVPGSATWSSGPSVAVGTLTATVTGLTAGTNYDYSVVTRNAAGPGASSATLTKPTTTTFTPSPAWTKIPPATSITMNDGRVVTVVSGVAYINGSPMGNTNSIVLMEISDTGVVYQKNSFNDWWYWNAQNEWIATSDPQAAPPTSGAPAPAAAVGYNTRTLGPLVVIGGANPNWFKNDGATVATTNGDGSVTLAGQSNNYNYGILTGDGHSFGTVFGGGMYVEIDCSWINPLNSTHGWPSLWANSAEGRLIPKAPNWPAGINAGGGGDAIEWDIMETFSDGWGPTVWDWSIAGETSIGTTYSPFSAAWNAQGGVHWPPADGTRRKIGALWVPATSTTQGRTEYYLNGTLIPSMTQRWNLWNSSVPLPLVNGTTADSIMDFQHFTMLAGTGAENPMRIYSIEIWQKDGTKNIPSQGTPVPTPPPDSGGPGTGPAFQNLNSFQDMGNGQKASTGMTTVANNISGNGYAQIAVKPYEYNGFWRGPALGNFLSPITAAFVSQGNYLYTPDVASIFSANGCPGVNPGINPIAGIRGHVRYFTAGNSIGPVSWGLYFEPGMTTDGHGDLYAVFTDYNAARGDTFHCSGAGGLSDSLVGLGVFRQTSWGSIYDLTGVSTGVPGYGLGWVAFIGYNMTAGQMIPNW